MDTYTTIAKRITSACSVQAIMPHHNITARPAKLQGKHALTPSSYAPYARKNTHPTVKTVH
jgi:hypothetical protein